MLKNIKIGILLFWFIGQNAVAQQSSTQVKNLNRVYSKYGIGEYTNSSTVRNLSMAHTGLASPSLYSINDKNPSLMVYNSAVSFEFSLVNEFRSSTNSNNEIYKDNELGMGSVRIAFPLFKNKWQTLFEVNSFSNTNYKLFEIAPIGTISDSIYSYESINGIGGVNQFSWKNGIKFTKNINLGLEMSYYFGNTELSQITKLKNTPNDYEDNINKATNTSISSVENFVQYSGFSSTPSVSIYMPLKKSNTDIFLGAKYDLSSNLNISNTKVSAIDYNIILDTIRTTTTFALPKGYGAGIGIIFKDSLKNDKLLMTVDYNSKLYTTPTNTIENKLYAFGMEKFANKDGNSFLSRNLYRFGAYFYENAILYQNTAVDEFGITFGIGIPMQPAINDRSVRPILDLGFTIGSHGGEQNTIKESFFRVNFGFTFNDRWFQKIRIN